jgi:hypothetical protein
MRGARLTALWKINLYLYKYLLILGYVRRSLFKKCTFLLITASAIFTACHRQSNISAKQGNNDDSVEIPANYRKYKIDTYDTANFTLTEITNTYFDSFIGESAEVAFRIARYELSLSHSAFGSFYNLYPSLPFLFRFINDIIIIYTITQV